MSISLLELEGVITSSQTAFLAYAQGQVSGHSVNLKFGKCNTVNNAETAISSLGTFWQPTTTSTLQAQSTSANDAAAGTGARVITVVGLNSSFNEVSEDITMNGTGLSSSTSTSFIRVYRAFVKSCGTYSATNSGDIVIKTTGGGVNTIQIQANRGQSQTSIFSVPVGYTAYVFDVHVGVSSSRAADVRWYRLENIDDVSSPFTAKRLVNSYDNIETSQDFTYNIPHVFPQKTDIFFTGQTNTGTTSVTVEYEILLIQN